MAEHDQCLVITFLESTHVLAMNAAEELDEADVQGFVTDRMTLFCASLDNDHTVQARAAPAACVAPTHGRMTAGSAWLQSTAVSQQ